MIDIANTSLPFASATLPPCVEHAITCGPADDETLDWIMVLARFWKGLGADKETVARDIEAWYTDSDAIEDLNTDEITSLVNTVYSSDRSRADCPEMYRLKSFQDGCARADCIFFNPPTKTDSEAMPELETDSFMGHNQGIDLATLSEELVRRLNIKRLPGGQLAVYNNGIYATDDSEILIDKVVRTYLRNNLTTKFKGNLMLHVKAVADPVSWDDFERFTHLLCCPNCVVDLTSGQALDHSPHYMMLHKTRVAYKPKAGRDLWLKTLDEIIVDAKISSQWGESTESQLDYFKTLWGYSITGETRDEILAIHQGPGASGKTTITSAIQYALGSYVLQVDPDILMAKSEIFKPAYELAGGVGKRIFLTNESKEGAKLNSQLIKRIATEGQEFNARQIRERPFTYTLRAKAHLVMNPPPILDEQDKSISRRLHLIKYLVDFSKGPDKTLKRKLQSEAEGVLAWLVEGAITYYKDSLKPTEAITSAVDELFADSDPLYGFIDANIEQAPGEKVSSRGLYLAFKTHCNSRFVNTDRFDPRAFGRAFAAQLKLRGWNVPSYRSHGETVYRDIRFMSEQGGA
jgi:P4 family phage/plasmid primase-like protien